MAGCTVSLAHSRRPWRPWRRKAIVALPMVAAGLGLWWSLRGMDWMDLVRQVEGMDAGWLAAAVIFDLLGYIAQGLRWKLLLGPLGELSFGKTTEAIYAGLFVNEVLPMRAGEAVRGVVVSRELRQPLMRVVPSMVTERLLDGFWLAVGIVLVAVWVPLPSGVREGITVLCAAMLIAACVAGAVRRLRSDPTGRSGWLGAQLRRLRNRLGPWPSVGEVRAAWLISAVVLACQSLAFWSTATACHIELGMLAGTAVLLMIRLGTTIPSAPANAGAYQFFCTLGMTALGISREVAAPFSLVVFMALTVPLWIIGSICLGKLGMSLADVRGMRTAKDGR